MNMAWLISLPLNFVFFTVLCSACVAMTSVEILQKEVVVHKEMVAELRAQLSEKEQEFQVRIRTLLFNPM